MREVAVVTTSRADFGLLRPVMDLILAADDLRLRVLVGGTHLCPEFGLTVEEVREAGFTIDERVELILSGDSPTAICKSMGLAMIGFGEAIHRLSPHILLLLGDRFETLCAAAAAQICRVPVGHVHGGETSEGAVDEAFRHAITKMSHLHFASCDTYRRRLLQLGERPERVFNVGALGVENIRKMTLMPRSQVMQVLGAPADRPLLLVTFHPVTLERATAANQFAELLTALDSFETHFILFTKANADTEGRVINQMSDRFAARNASRAAAVSSLGASTYLSAMSHADTVVGNSSSGLIEAPALRVPTVNIGDRQKGRVRAASVLDCEPDADSIVGALKRATSPSFRESLRDMTNPCEQPETAATIVHHLRSAPLEDILRKPFIDLPVSDP